MQVEITMLECRLCGHRAASEEKMGEHLIREHWAAVRASVTQVGK